MVSNVGALGREQRSLGKESQVKTPSSSISCVPTEVCKDMVGYLGLPELRALSHTSRSFNEIGMKERTVRALKSEGCPAKWKALQNICTSLISGISHNGDFDQVDQAIEIADKIIATDEKATALFNVFEFLIHSRDIGRAIQVAKEIPDPCIRDRARKSICALLEEAGDFDQAIQLTKMMNSRPYQSSAISHLCKSLMNRGRVDEAAELAKSISDEAEQMGVIRDVCSLWTRVGRIDEALKLAKSMSDECQRSNVLYSMCISIVREIRDNGNMDRVDQAIRIADEIDGIFGKREKVDLLRDISRCLLDFGDTDKAIQVVRKMPDQSEREFGGGGMIDICEHLAGRGDIGQAMQLARTLDSTWSQENALRPVCRGLVRAGRSDEAVEVAKSMIEKELRMDALDGICKCLVAEGSLNKSIEVGVRIFNENKSEEGVRVLETLFHFLESRGHPDKAVELALACACDQENLLTNLCVRIIFRQGIEKAVEVATRLPRRDLQNECLRGISTALSGSESDQMDKAIEVAKMISSSWIQAFALEKIYANLQLRQNVTIRRVDQAVQLAKMISYTDEKEEILIDICACLAEVGFLDKVFEVVAAIPKEWRRGGILKKVRDRFDTDRENDMEIWCRIGDRLVLKSGQATFRS